MDGDGYEPGRFSTNMPSVKNPFSPPTDGVPETSTFSSPPKDKTLDPRGDIVHENGDNERKSRGRRSVGAAMIQAQAEATKQVEESLEGTHISEPEHKKDPPSPTTPRQSHPPRTSSLQHKENNLSSPFEPEPGPEPESPPSPQQRVILTPPGQAPIRGVPGPRVEVEKSPFLSDEDQEKEDVISRMDTPDVIFEDAKETQLDQERERKHGRQLGRADGGLHTHGHGQGAHPAHGRLSRRESWEDFDNDE